MCLEAFSKVTQILSRLLVSILDGTAINVLSLNIDTVMADTSCHNSTMTSHSECEE